MHPDTEAELRDIFQQAYLAHAKATFRKEAGRTAAVVLLVFITVVFWLNIATLAFRLFS